MSEKTHDVRLVPVGATLPRADGDGQVTLDREMLRQVAAETRRWIERHESRGVRHRPPLFADQGTDLHESTSTRWGDVEAVDLRDDGLYATISLNDAGRAARDRGALQTVSAGIGRRRDAELGETFDPVLQEVSPTADPAFVSARIQATQPRHVTADAGAVDSGGDETDKGNESSQTDTDSQTASEDGMSDDGSAESTAQAEGEGESTVEAQSFDEMKEQLGSLMEQVQSLAERVGTLADELGVGGVSDSGDESSEDAEGNPGREQPDQMAVSEGDETPAPEGASAEDVEKMVEAKVQERTDEIARASVEAAMEAGGAAAFAERGEPQSGDSADPTSIVEASASRDEALDELYDHFDGQDDVDDPNAQALRTYQQIQE